MGAGVRDRHSEPDCLTFLIITEETSKRSFAVAMETISPSPWRQPTGRQLLEWEEVPAGGGEKCPQTLLCCLRGGLEMPLCSGMRRRSRRCPQSSVSRPGCPGEAEAGRMVFCRYFWQRPFLEAAFVRVGGNAHVSCPTNAGNLPGQPPSLSEFASHLLGDLG